MSLLNRPKRLLIRYGKGPLQAQVCGESFHDAFTNFSHAAKAFALSLGDELNRNYAFEYLAYLQNVAKAKTCLKPHEFPGPACRLIRAELDRLFDLSFVLTEIAVA